MSKKPIIGGIILAAIIGVVFVGAQINPDNPENEKSPNSEVWSVRMATRIIPPIIGFLLT